MKNSRIIKYKEWCKYVETLKIKQNNCVFNLENTSSSVTWKKNAITVDLFTYLTSSSPVVGISSLSTYYNSLRQPQGGRNKTLSGVAM